MKDIRDAEPILFRKDPHAVENLRQAPAGDRAVHAIIIWRYPPNRGKSRLPPRPEGKPLRLVTAALEGGRMMVVGDFLDLIDQVVDLRRRTIQLDDQQRLDFERVAGFDKS